MAGKPATLVTIKQYFETTDRLTDGKLFKKAVDFGTQWKALSPKDQTEIREGIGFGTFNY
jgi:ATP-dependent protease HslVU (ClpYQ) peptidase subunit